MNTFDSTGIISRETTQPSPLFVSGRISTQFNASTRTVQKCATARSCRAAVGSTTRVVRHRKSRRFKYKPSHTLPNWITTEHNLGQQRTTAERARPHTFDHRTQNRRRQRLRRPIDIYRRKHKHTRVHQNTHSHTNTRIMYVHYCVVYISRKAYFRKPHTSTLSPTRKHQNTETYTLTHNYRVQPCAYFACSRVKRPVRRSLRNLGAQDERELMFNNYAWIKSPMRYP